MVRKWCPPLQSWGASRAEKCSVSSVPCSPSLRPPTFCVPGIIDFRCSSGAGFSVTRHLCRSVCQGPDLRIHSNQDSIRHSFPPGASAVGAAGGRGDQTSVSLWAVSAWGLFTALCGSRSVPSLGLCQLTCVLPCQALPINWCVISPAGRRGAPAPPPSCPGTWTPFSAPT